LLRRALGPTVRRVRKLAERCPEEFRPFIESIAERFYESGHPIFQIRREAGATEWHGKRLTKELGVAPGELRDFIRVEVILWLLRETPLPVAAIALLVGFENERSLRKLIGRKCGMTPGRLRRHLRRVRREYRELGDESLSWHLRVRYNRGEAEKADLAAVLTFLRGRFGPV
jgi:AraC-like DNA-binding protein